MSRAFTAAELNRIARAHWMVESLHWRLDVVMDEDLCRARRDHAAENLAVLRRLALGLLARNKAKGSGPSKMLQAALSPAFLLDLLG